MSATAEYKEPTRAIFVESDMRKFLGSTVSAAVGWRPGSRSAWYAIADCVWPVCGGL